MLANTLGTSCRVTRCEDPPSARFPLQSIARFSSLRVKVDMAVTTPRAVWSRHSFEATWLLPRQQASHTLQPQLATATLKMHACTTSSFGTTQPNVIYQHPSDGVGFNNLRRQQYSHKLLVEGPAWLWLPIPLLLFPAKYCPLDCKTYLLARSRAYKLDVHNYVIRDFGL